MLSVVLPKKRPVAAAIWVQGARGLRRFGRLLLAEGKATSGNDTPETLRLGSLLLAFGGCWHLGEA